METFDSFDLFISHGWHHSVEYMRIVEMLNDAPNFYWRNYSSLEKETIINPNTEFGKSRLIQQLEEQIQYAKLVITSADLYTQYPFWIEQDIAIAGKHNIPVIGVKPYDNATTPTLLSLHARALVKWEANQIIEAIKKYAV